MKMFKNFRSAPGIKPTTLPRPGETHINGRNDNPNIPAPKIERNKSMAQINVNDYIHFSRALSQIESDYFMMAKMTGQKDDFIVQRHEMFVELWDALMEDKK